MKKKSVYDLGWSQYLVNKGRRNPAVFISAEQFMPATLDKLFLLEKCSWVKKFEIEVTIYQPLRSGRIWHKVNF